MTPPPSRVFSPVFVTGVPRSGTTWVFDLLSKHPEAVGWFETWLFTPQGLSPLFGPRHWSGDPSRQVGLDRVISRERLVASVRDLVFSWVAGTAAPHQSVWVEKSPGNIDYDTIDELFPEARFVNVVRDGRDVALSIRAAARSWAPAWRRSFGRTIAHSARHWAVGVDRGLDAGERFGERWLEVRYEDLRAQPEVWLRRLWAHCGLTERDDLVARIIERTDLGRLAEKGRAGSESSFRRRGGVGEWRERFSPIERVVFGLLAGPQLKRLGYSDRRWPLSAGRSRRRRRRR